MSSIGSLTVVSTRFLIGLLVLCLLAWLTFLRLTLRRGRPRPRRGGSLLAGNAGKAGLAGVACLLTLALVADGVNSYFSYLPNVSDVVDAVANNPPQRLTPAVNSVHTDRWQHGRLFLLSVPDNGSGFGRSQAWVWLPRQYFTAGAAALPVVYLFHGSPGMPKDWFHGGEAGRIGWALSTRQLPAIVVAPQMSKNWLDDSECVDGLHERVETHLLRDVIPTVDRQLRTAPGRDARVFAGMSAGGYCALNLGLRHRELVSTVLDLSGYTEPTHSGGMTALFGRANLAAVAQNSPSSYAPTLRGGPRMRVWLDCGSADGQVLRELTALAPVLRADGMTVQQRVRPGGHTYSVWRPALKDSLTWALAGLART